MENFKEGSGNSPRYPSRFMTYGGFHGLNQQQDNKNACPCPLRNACRKCMSKTATSSALKTAWY